MKTARAVIGSGYGDEGKGLMTDYFCSKIADKSRGLVVRYNGGAQAGHTVVTPGGHKHTFSHIGCGSFQYVSTFLSEDFVTNPILFNREVAEFSSVPQVYIDIDALVTFPIDMLLNYVREEWRGSFKHGSCGAGVFETLRRCGKLSGSNGAAIVTKLSDTIKMSYHELQEMVSLVKANAYSDLKASGISVTADQKALLELNLTGAFYEELGIMGGSVIFTKPGSLDKFDTFVFEGAQGLLLSESHGVWPHLTPSNPGVSNPARLCKEFGIDSLDVTYVTRAYTTRHGAGPLNGETTKELLALVNTEKETNKENPFQDALRYAPFDTKCADAALNDYRVNRGDSPGTFSIAITCLDQVPDAGIANKIAESFSTQKVFKSFGSTRNDVLSFEME